MQMNTAILATTVGLVGSLVGGASTFAASWLTHRGEVPAQTLAQQSATREALYAEFIVEACRRFAEAWSHQAESPVAIAMLYSAVERMRLTSSGEVIDAADKVMRQIVEAYAEPDRSFDDLRCTLRSDEFRDPIRNFSAVCRADLDTLRSRAPDALRMRAHATRRNPGL